MKTKLLVGMLLAGSALFAAPRVSIGIGVAATAMFPLLFTRLILYTQRRTQSMPRPIQVTHG